MTTKAKPIVNVGFSNGPVFRDGLTTTLTYAILAVRPSDQYNCICYADYGTLKFYPSFEFWGLDEKKLHSMGLIRTYSRDNGGYQGVHEVSAAEVERLLAYLHEQLPKTTAIICPPSLVHTAFNRDEPRQNSRRLHPPTHYVPEIQYLPAPNRLLLEAA